MTTNHKKHQKHGKTKKANFGEFGRLELSILGTPCGNIKNLSQSIIEKTQSKNLAYVDADHKTEEEEKSRFLNSGSQLVYTDKISFQRFDHNDSFNRFQRNAIFNEYDLVLINGNHFRSNKQIIVIDEKKPLEKKLDKITDVLMVLFADEQREIPEYLQNHISDLESLPKFGINELDGICNEITSYIEENTPEIYGLVLSGGKSQRMQQDKAKLTYHGIPHREYLINQLDQFTSKTFVSCRKDQVEDLLEDQEYIVDTFNGLGPYGGILSAFRKHPDKSWLVLAVDLPILSTETIGQLIKNRNTSKIATAFYNKETDFPEPLITIWEPKAYSVLLHFLSLGYSCPRKVLINSNIELINPLHPNELINANNPEEYEKALELIKANN